MSEFEFDRFSMFAASGVVEALDAAGIDSSIGKSKAPAMPARVPSASRVWRRLQQLALLALRA